MKDNPQIERDPVDLLVYGTGELDSLSLRWESGIAAAGVMVSLPAGFHLSRHAGPLSVQLIVGEHAALPSAKLLHEQGTVSASFELYLEPMTPVSDDVEGLQDVPPLAARRIRRATFCAVISLSARSSQASCVAGFLAGVGLARVGAGVIADIEEELYWDADEALAASSRYLTDVLALDGRPLVRL